jgi:hypothetical protein
MVGVCYFLKANYYKNLLYLHRDNEYYSKFLQMKTGDKALADPKITGLLTWVKGIVIDIEKNPFKGLVIAIKDDQGRIYFGEEKYFKVA